MTIILFEQCFTHKRDFLKAETLDALKKQITSIIKKLKDKYVCVHACVQVLIQVLWYHNYRHFKGKELANFERDCHNYFMEVVSTLCFGGQSAPEPALIKSLIEIVLTEDSDLLSSDSRTSRSRSDKVSVVKSSLLQLLLEHK